MHTVLSLGPADHGRVLTPEEYEKASGREGYRYELIDGRLCVSPEPNLPHEQIAEWIVDVLKDYSRQYPEVINFVASRSRVIVPRADATSVQPDVAAYHDFPKHLPIQEVQWQDVSPVLVVEIVSEGDADKD